MALAYGDFHELSHQLRFLLFEIGIGLPQRSIEYFISSAHRECLRRLQYAAMREGLTQSLIVSHHIHDFLDQLQAQLKHQQPASIFFNWHALRHELDETIANEAMAQAYRQCWQLELSKQVGHFGNFWEWLCQKNNPHEIIQLAEQWGCLGHPYHPNFRAKMGFSRREVLQYSPEFNAQISLHWCALHKHHAYTSQGEHYKDLMAQQFPKEYQLWQTQLVFKHFDPEQYFPLPLHPWQWRNQIQNQFTQLLDSKELILMPHHQLVKPSMSFRTMMPIKAGSGHLKLAAAVHTTSAVRTVSPASIEDGPALSRWLNHLLEKHSNYQHRLFIAADLAGLRVNSNTLSADRHKQFAVVLRENPTAKLNAEQQLVPLGALFAPSPLSNKPLFIDIINASGLAATDYFRNYCQCVLSGQLHLLLRYGIAFEAHQQNTLIAFTQNQPTALVMRDFGNVSICQHPSYNHDLKPVFHSDSKIITDNLAELCSKFVHGNFQSNLAYWITNLTHHYGLTAKSLWQLVRLELQRQLRELSFEIEPPLFDFYQNQLLCEPWQHKSLLMMRLYKENNDYLSTPVNNPLSTCHE